MEEMKRRVMIVEDNRDANDSLAMLVEMLGFESGTGDGRTGCDRARDRVQAGCRVL